MVVVGGELGPYAGFGHRFGVRCADGAVAAYLGAALATLADGGGGDVDGCYELTGAGDRLRLAYRGEVLADGASARRAVGLLVWHVNRRAIGSATAGQLVLHAAVVARGGRALLLPAAMESGKTTLAAGLIDRGWSYLSDEAAAIRDDGRRVVAYPKPLSIDPGAQEVLRHWAPVVPDGAPRSLAHGQWQVAATARPGAHVVAEATVAAVVLPRYAPGAETALTPLSRAQTLARATTCAFAWPGAAARQRFATLAAAVRASRCAELVVGELHTACAAVDAWWERSG